VEEDLPGPVGEYAQSCVGRERVFEYFSREMGIRCLLYRLNYASDLRYGVLTDIARKVREGKEVERGVPVFNTLWQGDADSYALRSLEFSESPPFLLNVTGPEKLTVEEAAGFFARRWGLPLRFKGEAGETALLSNASRCHALLGKPGVTAAQLLEWTAAWVERGGRSLGKPTKFEVKNGKF
jgi:nucleoside-diphosphate-sugar epimerase